jgi:UDP-N-acetylglucosamine--N-acetylmuramyl-(pentapeptide) pyrophosphoryl-undecaprenol N-acetylglucosamine transferase
MTTYLLAGGGTAGHVNPLLALADTIRMHEPEAKIIALGTAEGLESRLVPERGFRLETIERLPFPRKPNLYALKFPIRFAAAVERVSKLIKQESVDIVVGFGGYASAPAYEAARRAKIGLVVHEANALPGMANKRAAKFASAVGVAFADTDISNAVYVGMPLRREISGLADSKDAIAARSSFGLQTDGVTLLVTGGSLGAKRLNDTIEKSRPALQAAGVQVLHIVGGRSELAPESTSGYCRIAYCDRMDLAIAASDFAIARAGASTVSEFSAVGLPAVYVPYPVGNGEQELNVQNVVSAGGAKVVKDADFTVDYIKDVVIPIVSNTKLIREMSNAARSAGLADGAERLYKLVQSVLKR